MAISHWELAVTNVIEGNGVACKADTYKHYHYRAIK